MPAVLPFFDRPSPAGTGSARFSAQPPAPSFIWRPWRAPALTAGFPSFSLKSAYVALTAGIYAGLQQRALGLRSRLLGNLIVALGVPALAQILDWLAHRAAGAAVPFRAILAVSIFAAVSALFHLL